MKTKHYEELSEQIHELSKKVYLLENPFKYKLSEKVEFNFISMGSDVKVFTGIIYKKKLYNHTMFPNVFSKQYEIISGEETFTSIDEHQIIKSLDI